MLYFISSSKDNVANLPKGLNAVLISRPLKLSVLKILVLDKNVRKIHCSNSCMKGFPKRSRKFFEENSIELVLDSFRGKPLSLSPEQILRFNELRKDGLSYRKIAEAMGISKSTAHYLMKYAVKRKLKNNGRMIGSG